MSGADVMAMRVPPLRFAVPDIIPEGLALLVGAPKAGKSYLATDFGVAVATGGWALDALRCERGPVLYLALEDGPRRMQTRLRQITRDADADLSALHIAYDPPPWPDLLAEVRDLRPRLLVVDVLAKVRAPSPGRAAYAEDYAALDPWKRLADREQVSVLVLHHDRKAQSSDFVDAVSGTHGLAGSADAVLLLERARMEDYALLKVTARDIPECSVPLRRVGPLWRKTDRMPDPNLGDRSNAVLVFAQMAGKPVGRQEVADALGVTGPVAGTMLTRLVGDGRLTRTGRGLYVTDAANVTLPHTGVTS